MITVLRLSAFAVAGFLLAGCTGSIERHAALGYYPTKSDADFHEGVARAHAMPVLGIDVSRWQGTIDWDEVRAAGTQFAFIKATEGGDHLDPRFHDNWDGARRAGVPRAAYHFVYWCRPAEEQMAWFRKNVPADPDALPPVLDVEWNWQSRNCPRQTSPERALKKIEYMVAAMEAHTGKRPIIYTDIPFHKQVLEGRLRDHHFWLRSVAAEPDERYANRPWLFWQFTTTGRVPGIEGDVDRNAFNGSMDDWRRFVQRHRDSRIAAQ